VRRRLSLLVAATTSVVVLAFLIPLALLMRELAEYRALTNATNQNLTALAAAATALDVLHSKPPKVLARTTSSEAGQTAIFLTDGTVIGPAAPGTDPGGVDEARRTKQHLTRLTDDGGAVVYDVLLAEQQTVVARTVIPRGVYHKGVAAATAIVAGLGLGMLLLAMFAADRLGGRISRPIHDLAVGAKRMRDGHLDVRVAERGPREVTALATALNQLAARVEKLLAAERDAVADLAHRLRTPVTALRLDADSISDTEVADLVRGHVAQLERTVDAIVHDAKRPTRAGGNSCDVGKVVSERVDFWSALAEEQGREMRKSVPNRPMRARLDAAELADVVDVLIDNVFAHTEEGVPLEVWVAPRADGAVVLTVEDGGTGLPQADIIARGSSGAGSTGLGMDIVRRAANASGGGMEVGRSRLGGALIRVVLGSADR
jgi:signal transduction histidine kinase